MRTKLKAIRSKPAVCRTVAVGGMQLDADDLADVSILTAIYRGIIGKDKALWNQIAKSGMAILREWQERKESFELARATPRKSKC